MYCQVSSYTQTSRKYTSESRRDYNWNMPRSTTQSTLLTQIPAFTRRLSSRVGREQNRSLRPVKGVNADVLESYIDERMWRDRWGQTTEAAFNNICAHIAEQYPVWRSQVNSYTQTAPFRATKIFRKKSKLLCIITNSF